jgi:hypothetical protein
MQIDEQLKQQLGHELCALLDGMTLTEILMRWRIMPSRMSELRNGKPVALSLVALLRILARMDYDIELTLRPRQPVARPRPPASARVVRYDRYGKVVV